MKKILLIIVGMILCGLLAVSCNKNKETDIDNNAKLSGKKFIVGEDISISDITEFNFTYSDIDEPKAFDTHYLRYYLYEKDNSHFFFYEKKEGKKSNGLVIEENTIASGTVQLTDEQWTEFFDNIRGGTVTEKTLDTELKDSLFRFDICWNGDEGKYREYAFTPDGDQHIFEASCGEFATAHPQPTAEEYPPIDDTSVGNWTGYFADVSGQYHMEIGEAVDGVFPAKLSFSWMFSLSDGGMYTDLVDIEGKVLLSEEGITLLEGILEDSSEKKDKKFKAVIADKGDDVEAMVVMVVIESENNRLKPGSKFKFYRSLENE